MAEKEIGTVVHYFDKARVAVVKLTSSVSTGDAIKIKKGDNEFTDIVESMQIEHEPIMRAERGQEVAIKISQKTKEGATVYKVEE
jgi:putative protease